MVEKKHALANQMRVIPKIIICFDYNFANEAKKIKLKQNSVKKRCCLPFLEEILRDSALHFCEIFAIIVLVDKQVYLIFGKGRTGKRASGERRVLYERFRQQTTTENNNKMNIYEERVIVNTT